MSDASDPNTQLRCEACGAEFADADYLRDHQLMHETRCPVCGAEFTTEAMLADHRRTHDATSPAEQHRLMEQQGERKS
jgi:hypothetical protein